MHLSHQIPWNGASRHLKFMKENKAIYERPSALFPRNDATQEKDLMHFVRVFADTIVEFSQTERRKFPAKMDAKGPLFEDELLEGERFSLLPFDENNNRAIPISKEMQQLQVWKENLEENDATYHGALADAVKFLIQQNQSKTLLTLSQAVPLEYLFNCHWGHAFGVSLVAYETLRLYLILNLAYAVQQQQMVAKCGKEFCIFELDALRRQVLLTFSNDDFGAQFIMHRQFWEKYVQYPDDKDRAIFQDPAVVNMDDLKAYLAYCFRVLYLFDMVMHERGEQNTRDYWIEEVCAALSQVIKTLWLSPKETE